MLEDVVLNLLQKHNKTIAVAESCTGGLLSNLLTNVQGSSNYFLEGIVSYSNEAKMDLISVPEKIIEEFGAVSEETAKAMASGVKRRSKADIGLATTGLASPTVIEEGADKGKPVGLVYVALAIHDELICEEYRFIGPRLDIKQHAANAALNLLKRCLLD